MDETTTDLVIIGAGDLGNSIRDILLAFGAGHRDAEVQAIALVEGDLRGQHSHGVRRLQVLARRLRNDLVRSNRSPTERWVTESVVKIDGNRGFGPPVAFSTVDTIIERADHTGIALAAIRNSNHVGLLAPYVERIAAAGDIGVAMTTSEALVHPWGGRTAMVGTNPLAIAVPSDHEPLVLDMSTAAVSMGKILDYADRGEPIPIGWAVDPDGTPTTDPAAASHGAISPFGGAKGYALGIALEAVVGVLSESALGRDVRGTLDTEDVCSKGDVFIAISLERLGLVGVLPYLARYFDDVRASGTDPSQPLTIPGDRARALRRQRLADGIPLHREVWAGVQRLRQEAGLDD